MVRVLQHIAVSSPAGSTLTKTVSKNGHVALARHDVLQVRVHGYAEVVAVAGKYVLQIRIFSSNPGHKVLYLLSLAVLGRSHEHQLWPLSLYQSLVEALELIGDLVLPPADLHPGAAVSSKRPETNLALLPLVVRNAHTRKRGLADLRKYARITRNL